MSATFEIVGMKELEQLIKDFGNLPQKCVNRAAKKGARVAMLAAKRNAPVYKGVLRKNIYLKAEKTKKKGKKVYAIAFRSSFFNAINANGSETKKQYFYPALQEFGFKNRANKYVPGYNYLKRSLDENKNLIEQTMIKVLDEEINKL